MHKITKKDVYPFGKYVSHLEKEARFIYNIDIPLKKVKGKRMLLSQRSRGIKIHESHGYDIEEYGGRLFSFANEQKAVILMHPQKVEKIPSFANRYPDMKLIIAHLSSMEHIAAIGAIVCFLAVPLWRRFLCEYVNK